MTKLAEILSAGIKQRGPATFNRFMEMALYHPQYGYYSSNRLKIGGRGDFYTAPTVSPLFGAMVARQLAEMWRLAGAPGYWTLVEYGPGTGKLAGDIMDAVLREHPALYRAVNYHLVEISPGLEEQQRRQLANHQTAVKFHWSQNLSDISPDGLDGCILANELVDAFPVHLVRQNRGALRELYVDTDGENSFHLVEGPLSTPELKEYFVMQNINLAEGQRAEVNLKAAAWLAGVAAHLRRGYVMVIDYGATADSLYGRHRFNGTLRCFHRHRLVDDPLVNVGGQDITAHVNFTALAMQGEKAGLQTLGLVSQPQFLLNLGIMDTLKEHNDFTYSPARQKKTMAIKQLVLPGGMGDIFKVLIWAGGMGPPALTGLTGPVKKGD
ncbi:MAG: SAM-dependent methyltransferase [Firmicutes bacterium]|nr:SAM-dependent methyltransferase [Bacillota bacterium]